MLSGNVTKMNVLAWPRRSHEVAGTDNTEKKLYSGGIFGNTFPTNLWLRPENSIVQ